MQKQIYDLETSFPHININVCVIHYSKLKHRIPTIDNINKTFNNITNRLKHVTVNIKIIENFDPETLHPDFIKRVFNSDELTSSENTTFNKFKINSPNPNLISNCLKHMEALKFISTQNDTDFNIILEDDVFYNDKFEQQFEELLTTNNYENFDMIFFGLPGEKPKEYVEDGPIIIADTDINDKGILPCCDSYYIKNTAAKALTNLYIPIKYPNNVHLSYVIDKCKLKCGRTYPNLLVDGSKIGFATSTLSPNNILLFNNAYKLVYKILEKPGLTSDDLKIIDDVFTKNTIKNNPDFLFLEGLYNMKLKQYDKTKILFDEAYEHYVKNCSPLNNQSALIQNYIDLSKYLQKKIDLFLEK